MDELALVSRNNAKFDYRIMSMLRYFESSIPYGASILRYRYHLARLCSSQHDGPNNGPKAVFYVAGHTEGAAEKPTPIQTRLCRRTGRSVGTARNSTEVAGSIPGSGQQKTGVSAN